MKPVTRDEHTNKIPLRQKVRKTLIIFSFILLPVTFAYIACPIIIRGASEGVMTGGLLIFLLIFTGSSVLGRFWCGYLCPVGGYAIYSCGPHSISQLMHHHVLTVAGVFRNAL